MRLRVFELQGGATSQRDGVHKALYDRVEKARVAQADQPDEPAWRWKIHGIDARRRRWRRHAARWWRLQWWLRRGRGLLKGGEGGVHMCAGAVQRGL